MLACALATTGCGDDTSSSRAGSYRPSPSGVIEQELPPAVDGVTDGYMAVELRRDTPLYTGPDATRTRAVVDEQSIFLRSTMWLPVLDGADNDMVQVPVPWVEGTKVAWLDPAGLQRRRNEFLVVVSMERGRMYVLHDGEIEQVGRVTLGDEVSPTPRGTFAITDRVEVPVELQDTYGRRALGMSVLQDQLPPGWSGGNQVAIHGGPDSPDPSRTASTAGCIVVTPDLLEWLWRRTPPGTLVVVQR